MGEIQYFGDSNPVFRALSKAKVGSVPEINGKPIHVSEIQDARVLSFQGTFRFTDYETFPATNTKQYTKDEVRDGMGNLLYAFFENLAHKRFIAQELTNEIEQALYEEPHIWDDADYLAGSKREDHGAEDGKFTDLPDTVRETAAKDIEHFFSRVKQEGKKIRFCKMIVEHDGVEYAMHTMYTEGDADAHAHVWRLLRHTLDGMTRARTFMPVPPKTVSLFHIPTITQQEDSDGRIHITPLFTEADDFMGGSGAADRDKEYGEILFVPARSQFQRFSRLSSAYRQEKGIRSPLDLEERQIALHEAAHVMHLRYSPKFSRFVQEGFALCCEDLDFPAHSVHQSIEESTITADRIQQLMSGAIKEQNARPTNHELYKVSGSLFRFLHDRADTPKQFGDFVRNLQKQSFEDCLRTHYKLSLEACVTEWKKAVEESKPGVS